MLRSLFSPRSAALGLFLLSACAYQLPPQPTVFITRQDPDRLSEILTHHPLPVGKLAVLGGQILRRFDTPAGRYFLIRNLPLDRDAYPQTPSGKVVINPKDEFILFAPALHIMGEHRTKQKRENSAFVVFGKGKNQTVSMGPGHILTAVGEIGGMSHFPGDKKKSPHYLLLVSHYVMLWQKARPEDYPLVIK